jgi:hypothetical protein
MKTYTLDDLKSMSPDDRAVLYQHAVKLRDKGGQAIIDLINESGLPLRSGGMRMSDPIYLTMEDIIWRKESQKAAIEATERGLPALAGVEQFIRAELGERYHPHDQGTMNAGYIVGELMRHLGYDDNGAGKMPDGCVAKTAMKWKRRTK